MRITFLGAAKEVTGSKHLIEVRGEKILLDCGMFQGKRAESEEKNRSFPFDPKNIDAVILGHAHIDHSGSLPALVKNGFSGPIFSTKPTADLCYYMLADSAYLQEKDIEFINKKRAKRELELLQTIYTAKDALDAVKQFVERPYNERFHLTSHISAKFREAGHILGSALTELNIREGRKTHRIAYLVDLGRRGLPLLKNPEQINTAETFILESTYGDRTHDPFEFAKKKLEQTINRTLERGGKIVVPSFAMERTQELLFCLHELTREKSIPEIPIYIDSPLAINITQVFRRNIEFLDRNARKMILNNEDPFGFGKVRYVRNANESKALNDDNSPMVIISASGMCEAGRILHHLKNNIENPKSTILIVGFQAQNTLGRKLVEKVSPVNILGESYKVRADVVTINSFSAHPDRNELLEYVKNAGIKLKRIFLVHGEEAQITSLAQGIRELRPNIDVFIPNEGDSVEL